MCEDCAYRPELVHCSQCRTPLYAQDGRERISRNRALEQLASRTFPAVQEQDTLARGNRGGRGRGRGRATLATRMNLLRDILNFFTSEQLNEND